MAVRTRPFPAPSRLAARIAPVACAIVCAPTPFGGMLCNRASQVNNVIIAGSDENEF